MTDMSNSARLPSADPAAQAMPPSPGLCAPAYVEELKDQPPLDENAILAMLKERLEAEGAALEPSNPFPPGVPLDPCTVFADPRQPPKSSEIERDVATSDWSAAQQPAPVSYLRELVQLARESGMTSIRTGNLEIRFDPERAPAKQPGSREQF